MFRLEFLAPETEEESRRRKTEFLAFWVSFSPRRGPVNVDAKRVPLRACKKSCAVGKITTMHYGVS